MISSIVEQPKFYFLNVWAQIRPELPWRKFMKTFVVHINRLPGWSGCLIEPVCISIPWTLIVSRSIKGCEEYQWFGDLLLVPAVMIHPIIKSWSFRGWGLDFIVQVHFWALRNISWHTSFTKKQRAYVDTQNWHDSGFLDNLDRPVRPLF